MKYATIPFAGEIVVPLPDDFERGPDEGERAVEHFFDTMPDDFDIHQWMRTQGGQYDFHPYLSRGNVWYAETTDHAFVEEE